MVIQCIVRSFGQDLGNQISIKSPYCKWLATVNLCQTAVQKICIIGGLPVLCCCFPTVTHSYQDLLARYILGHAMRMFLLCPESNFSGCRCQGSNHQSLDNKVVALSILPRGLLCLYCVLEDSKWYLPSKYSKCLPYQLANNSTKHICSKRIMLKPNVDNEEIVLGMSLFVPRNCVGLLALFLHSGTRLARQYQLRSWKSVQHNQFVVTFDKIVNV